MALPLCGIRARWWHTQGRLRPRQPPAPSSASGFLDFVMTPDQGGGGGRESTVAAAQVYYNLKLIQAEGTVSLGSEPGVVAHSGAAPATPAKCVLSRLRSS
ncbi:unnamed protein product [Schistocephalus solidus]|uniref:Uncharacterized protein n=1 Tax=Schistocephalus solidus TaxID=70667 RepID=A0A183TDK9_SCHSO|nr:unnamed protein product [Schistocephalus solidus]